MKEMIHDVLKRIGQLGFIDAVLVTGTDDETRIEALDMDKTAVVKAKLKAPQSDLKGTYGIKSIPLLNGLLGFASYNTEDATFEVIKRNTSSGEIPEEFRFRDEKGQGSNFRLTQSQHIPEQPTIRDVAWDVVFEPTKSKLQELTTLSSLYANFDDSFSLKTVDGSLVVTIGDENAANHSVTMVLEDEVESGEVKGSASWKTAQFLSVLRIATAADENTKVSISNRGLIEVKFETQHSEMSIYLPGFRR